MKKIKFIVSLFLFYKFSFAQHSPALVSFDGFQYKDSIFLNFVMKGGYSCNGIDIERSGDSLNFYFIGDIQGICGSSSTDEPYRFVDRSPLQNANNFYRLDLKNNGYSQIIKINFTKLNIAGYNFFPNPCSGECALYFENPSNKEVMFFLYASGGKLIQQIKQRGTQIEIDKKNLSQGIYYYRLLKDDEIKIAGKFVVL